jgi:hypothetical protein
VELEDGEVVGYVSLMETGTLEADAAAMADKLKRKAGKQGKVKPLDLKVRVLYSFCAGCRWMGLFILCAGLCVLGSYPSIIAFSPLPCLSSSISSLPPSACSHRT